MVELSEMDCVAAVAVPIILRFPEIAASLASDNLPLKETSPIEVNFPVNVGEARVE